MWANFSSVNKGKKNRKNTVFFFKNLSESKLFCTLRLIYGECLDISFVISYSLSPAGGISTKRTVLDWINFNPLHLGMLCTKFSWIWPSGSGEEEGNVNSLHRRWLRRWWTMDKMWSVKLTCSGELKSVQKRRCWPVNVMLVCSIRC